MHAESLEAHAEAREFALYLTAAEKATNTVRAYIRSVTLFLDWAHGFGINWKTVTLAQMARFKWKIEAEPVRTKSGFRAGKSVNAVLTGTLEFLRYCALADLIERDVPERLAEPRWLRFTPPGFDAGESGRLRAQRARVLKASEFFRRPQVLSDDHLAEVFGHCRTARDEFTLTLLLDTGVRIGEALGMRRSDMHFLPDSVALGCDFAGAHVHVQPRRDHDSDVRVKGGFPRHIPVPASTVGAYVRYQAERDTVPDAADVDYVFVNLFGGVRGRPMTYSAMKKVFIRIGRLSGFPVWPHMFRHTAATRWLYEGGATRDTVQHLLGHRSPMSTAVYLHPSDDALRAAVDSTATHFARSIA